MPASVTIRTRDWDKASELEKAVRRLSKYTGSKWRVTIHGNHADLWVHRHQITKSMTISETRAFVEGMIVVI